MTRAKSECGANDVAIGPDNPEGNLEPGGNAERDPSQSDQGKAIEEGVEDAGDAILHVDVTVKDQADTEVEETEEVTELRRNVSELSASLEEVEDRLLRALADADNARKRAARDLENVRKFGVESLAGSLLAVLDNFDRALGFLHNAAADGEVSESIVEGIELTQKSLLDALRGSGIEDLSPLGEAFDPSRHKAMSMIPNSGKPPGSVVEVIRKGYMLHDRLLREAEVVVAAPSPEDAGDGPPEC